MSNHYEGTSRIGLYLMVFVVLLHSCDTRKTVHKIERQLDGLENQLAKLNGSAP